MMKTLALLATLTIVLLASSGSALALTYDVVTVYGYVSDSLDMNPPGDSYGRDVMLCRDDAPTDCLTESVGAEGGSNPEELYKFNCGSASILTTPCHDGDVFNVMVPDDGNGYYAGPEQIIVDVSIPNGVPEMTLAKDCTNTDSVLTVSTDADVYDQGDDVTVTAHFEDENCEPIVGAGVTIQYTDSLAVNGVVCDGENTNDDGEVICVLGLPGDAAEGEWEVIAAFGGYYDTDTFNVYDCNQDGDESERTECGGDDCDDTDPTSYPGADELCDGIDNDCDGVTDEDFTNLGDSCSAGIGACLRTGVFVCTVDKLGTECSAVAASPGTEVCGNGDEDCDGATDEDGVCGGGGGSYSPGGTATNYCGNLYCDTGEDCESCPGDCGECEEASPGEGEQCVPDWSCGEWTECSPEGSQTRTCEDINECEGAFTPPDTEQTCVYTAPAGDDTQGADVTGLVIGDPVMGLYWAAIITMVVLAGGIILWKRKGI